MDIQLTSTVTWPPDRKFVEHYEIYNAGEKAQKQLTKYLDAFAAMSKRVNTGGVYHGVLDLSIDGKPQSTLTVDMTQANFHRVQLTTHQWGAALLKAAQAKA